RARGRAGAGVPPLRDRRRERSPRRGALSATPCSERRRSRLRSFDNSGGNSVTAQRARRLDSSETWWAGTGLNRRDQDFQSGKAPDRRCAASGLRCSLVLPIGHDATLVAVLVLVGRNEGYLEG